MPTVLKFIHLAPPKNKSAIFPIILQIGDLCYNMLATALIKLNWPRREVLYLSVSKILLELLISVAGSILAYLIVQVLGL